MQVKDDAEQQAVNEGFADIRIGQRLSWVHGVYAGIIAGTDGLPDGHIIVLDRGISSAAMTWEAARESASLEGYGRASRLPTNSEARLVAANLPGLFDAAAIYWTLSPGFIEVSEGVKNLTADAIEVGTGCVRQVKLNQQCRFFAVLRIPARLTDKAIREVVDQATALDDLHTAGPISYHEDGEADFYAILDETHNCLLSLHHNGRQLSVVQEANLRRLVACWNACQGIKTADLVKRAAIKSNPGD